MVSESKKERWKEKREAKRKEHEDLQKKQHTKKIIIWTVVIIIGVLIALFAIKKMNGPGKYDSFAKCMTENDMTMYGTDWCSFCQRQKQLFKKSFDYVHYVNCDIGTTCEDVGVKSYPTWAKEGELFPSGVKSLAELAKISNCKLP